MRELKKILSGVMAAALILSASACQNQNGSSVASEGTENTTSSGNDNFNAAGWPVVKETVTLNVYGSRNSNAYEDYNEYKLLQDMEQPRMSILNGNWWKIQPTTIAKRLF